MHPREWLPRWSSVRRWRQAAYQLGRVDTQAGCQLEDVVQGQVATAALHLTDERPVQAAVVSQLFLALPQLMAAGPDALTKGSRRW